MQSLTSWLSAAGRGLWRSLVYAGIGLIFPVSSALLPVAGWLGLVGGPWSWFNPWSWTAMAALVTIPTLALAHPVAKIHRRLLYRWSAIVIEDGYRRQPEPVRLSTGYWWNGYSYERSRRDAEGDQRWRRLTERAFWREVRWVFIAGLVIAPICAVPLGALVGAGFAFSYPAPLTVALGTALLAVGAVTAPLAWRVAAPLAERWLRVTENAAQRIPDLERQRAEMIATHDAEIRRIERDLHDGAQARLVAVGLDLATAERLMSDDPDRALALLREARKGTSVSLAELRELVRGVYPSVLIERGAVEAIRGLALDSAADVHVEAPDDLRLPSPVEAAIYFGVAELIANAAKHTAGARIDVVVRPTAGALEVVVRDDGPGGAVVGEGGGLAGVRRRLAAFDGTLTVASPEGGPTEATMRVPCESS